MTYRRQSERHLGKTNLNFYNLRQFKPLLLAGTRILILALKTLVDEISHTKVEKKN